MAQIAQLSGLSVPNGTDNAFPHGLVRTPTIVALLFGSEANVTVSDPIADATNIYLDNGSGGPAENAEVLVIAPHSIIA